MQTGSSKVWGVVEWEVVGHSWYKGGQPVNPSAQVVDKNPLS
jgi:hypothetical protein